MPTLVVLLDGLGGDFLRDAIDAGRAPRLASIAVPGCFSEFSTAENDSATVACVTTLTGVWGNRHHVLASEELDGTGRLRRSPLQRRAVRTVPEIADQAGKRCLLVNVPFLGSPKTAGTVAVTDAFFNSKTDEDADAPRVYPGDLAADLKPLLLAPGAIGDAHLRQLTPGLLELASHDRRRLVVRNLLARALSIQNVATALADSDDFDVVCVRYDTIDAFFSAFIDHWPNPQPYISPTDAARLADLLPAVIELHDQFIGRLIELVRPDHLLAASARGYWRELRRPFPIGTPESFEYSLGVRDSPQKPAVSREFHRPTGWIAWGTPGLDAGVAGGVTQLTHFADILGRAIGLAPESLREPRPEAEPIAESIVAAERALDDLLELGIARLPDMVDAAREQAIQDALRTEAVHSQLSGNAARTVELTAALLRRIFDFADAARLLQAFIDSRRYKDARRLAETVARLAPGNLVAHLALAHVRFGCGDLSGGREALELAAGIDPADARVQNAARIWGCSDLTPRAGGPYAMVDHSAGATFLLDRPEEWWLGLQQAMAPKLAALDAAHGRLCDVAARAPHDLAEQAPPLEGNPWAGSVEDRQRTGSLSSVSRHADPDQAKGLAEAHEALLETGDAYGGSVIALARSLHSRIYAGEPRLAGAYRTDVGTAVRRWLDGRREANGIFTGPDLIAGDMQRLEQAMARHAGIHPALLAGALPIDFCTIHPFLDGNGRTSRLLMQHMLLRGGYTGVRWINLERRIDRCRSLYESSLVHTRATDSNSAIEFVVDFFHDAFADAAARFERLLAL